MEKKIKNGLIVSCQALPGEPLYGSGIMARMAYAAKLGGAVAIRANGAEDIADIHKNVDLPIIGLIKTEYPESEIYITPTKAEIDVLGNTCCDVIALDATFRKRPNGEILDELYSYIRGKYPQKEIMADISSIEEARYAASLGFDYVSSTLYGYTEKTKGCKLPGFGLLKKMEKTLKNCVVIAEGGIWTLSDVSKLRKIGINHMVIGTAITRPMEITKRFASQIMPQTLNL